MPELDIIMPVYNEEQIISKVVDDWVRVTKALGIKTVIKLYNDGSTDNTLAVLREKDRQYEQVKVFNNSNSGHGPTIMKGYKEARSQWIFQVDSDDEMKAAHFDRLWRHRDAYDFLIGIRENRCQTLTRKCLTLAAGMTVKHLFAPGVRDVNCPYRLMRADAFQSIFQIIPANAFAPNVMISGLAPKKGLRIFETDIPIVARTTGQVSIRNLKLVRAAAISWYQTVKVARSDASQ